MEREAWARGLIGMSKELGVSSKQLLALCSVLFTVYCLLSFLAISAPVSADTMEPEWVARYDSPVDSKDIYEDSAKAIAVDKDGNVYVTGESYEINTAHDYITIKYDTNGQQLWVNRYNGPESLGDFPSDITIDNEGNVYVTGKSMGKIPITEYATIKYDPDGQQLWVNRYNGPREHNEPVALAVDNFGNVYVTGQSEGSNGYPDYATVKYDPEGNQLWVARYKGADKSYDYPKDMALDNAGNVYVTGESGIFGSNGSDYATVKYNSEGHQLWVARYNGPMDRTDRAKSIVVDPDGNCYVTGGSDITGGGRVLETYRYFATIKYNPQGQEIWVARYEGGEARDIAMDSRGNIYVVGGSVIVKYNNEANQLWVTPSLETVPVAITLDLNDNLYVLGGSGYSGYLFRYNDQGKEVWLARYIPKEGNVDIRDLAIDNKGYIYLTGTGSNNSDQYYVTLKYWLGVEGVKLKSLLNQVIFYQGDTLTWDVSLKGSGRVDVYLAVVLPSGDFICLADTQGNTGAYNTAVPILEDWSILPESYRIISYTFRGKEPKGEYQLYIILTRPRANPSDRSKWLVYDAFSFIVP